MSCSIAKVDIDMCPVSVKHNELRKKYQEGIEKFSEMQKNTAKKQWEPICTYCFKISCTQTERRNERLGEWIESKRQMKDRI